MNVFISNKQLPKKSAIIKIQLKDLSSFYEVMDMGWYILKCKDSFSYMMYEDIITDDQKQGLEIYICFYIENQFYSLCDEETPIKFYLKTEDITFYKKDLDMQFTFIKE